MLMPVSCQRHVVSRCLRETTVLMITARTTVFDKRCSKQPKAARQGERERERESERGRDRETERQRQRDRETERQR